jgi:hypothetical protein
MAHDAVSFQVMRAEQRQMDHAIHWQVFTGEKQSPEAEVPPDTIPVNPRPACVDFDGTNK